MTTTTAYSATTVRRLLEAFLAGDVETFVSYMDNDVTLTVRRPSGVEVLPGASVTTFGTTWSFHVEARTDSVGRQPSGGHGLEVKRHDGFPAQS